MADRDKVVSTSGATPTRQNKRGKKMAAASHPAHITPWQHQSLMGLPLEALVDLALTSMEEMECKAALEELEQRVGWQQAASSLSQAGGRGEELARRSWGQWYGLPATHYAAERALPSRRNPTQATPLNRRPAPDLPLTTGNPAWSSLDASPLQLKREAPGTRSSMTTDELRSRLGEGQSLDQETRERMERALGLDLSQVRIYADTRAAELAAELGARAFTVGTDVVFGAGTFRPGSPDGDQLLAHELGHVVQQARGEVQNPEAGQAEVVENATLERRADQVAGQVMVYDTFSRERDSTPATLANVGTHNPLTFGSLAAEGAGLAIQRWGISDAWDAVSSSVGDIKAKALEVIKGFARRIPGYDLITTVVGYDPVAGKAVERNGLNILKGLVGLIPGGSSLFENLEKSGAITKGIQWISGEVSKLNLTPAILKDGLMKVISSLGLTDLASPSGILAKVQAVFTAPWQRIKNFAGNVANKVMEFSFEGFIGQGGGAASQVLATLKKAGGLFLNVLKNPVGFLGQLIEAIQQGAGRFGENILDHLKNGMIQWLVGTLAKSGISLPQTWDAGGILSLVMQVTGLNYDFFRQRLVKHVGEERTNQLEETFDFVQRLRSEGLGAAKDIILESVGNITEMVLGSIREFVVGRLVKSGLTKLASMFTPAGALIQAILGIYNTIMFFIERIEQIRALVESVTDSISNIAAGKVGAAAAFIEKAMARAIPVLLGFLARLVGLGNLADKIKDILKKIQDPIHKAVDKVIDWVVKKGQAALEAVKNAASGEKKEEGAATTAGADKVGNAESEPGKTAEKVVERGFDMAGAAHTIIVTFGPSPKIEMASKKDTLSAKVGRAVASLIKKPVSHPDAQAHKDEQIADLKQIGGFAKKAQVDAEKPTPNPQVAADLANAVAAYGAKYHATDIDDLFALSEAQTSPNADVDLMRQQANAAHSQLESARTLPAVRTVVQGLAKPLDGGKDGSKSSKTMALTCVDNTIKAIERSRAYLSRTGKSAMIGPNIDQRLVKLFNNIPPSFSAAAANTLSEGPDGVKRGVDVQAALKKACFKDGILDPENISDQDTLENKVGGLFKVFCSRKIFEKLDAPLRSAWKEYYGNNENDAFGAWLAQTKTHNQVALVPENLDPAFEPKFRPYMYAGIPAAFKGSVTGFVGALKEAQVITTFDQALSELALEARYYPSGVMIMITLTGGDATAMISRMQAAGKSVKVGKPSLFYQMVFPDNNYIADETETGYTAGADGKKDAAKSKMELTVEGIPEADFIKNIKVLGPTPPTPQHVPSTNTPPPPPDVANATPAQATHSGVTEQKQGVNHDTAGVQPGPVNAASSSNPEPRSLEDKKAAVEAAANAAERVMRKPEATVESVRMELPSIKDTHQLESISLTGPERGEFRVTAKINPEKSTPGIPLADRDEVWELRWREKQAEVVALFQSFVPRFQELDREATVHIRGSLATGLRHHERRSPDGQRLIFNPDDFDIDAYLVSDRLYREGVAADPDAARRGQVPGSRVPRLRSLIAEVRRAQALVAGNRNVGEDAFKFNILVRTPPNAGKARARDQSDAEGTGFTGEHLAIDGPDKATGTD